MIYCVVPEALVDQLYDKLVEHYAGDENVTVIVERRQSDRRARGSRPSEEEEQRREVRDRRRARVPGEFQTLATPPE